jgi:hypothetical protein
MATPDTTHSLVLIKQFNYRGTTKQWSNRYHFEGAVPADSSAWDTLAGNVATAEKAIYKSYVTIVEAIGYDAGTATSTNPHGDAVYTATRSDDGTLTATNFQACPGDAAMLIRWSTAARTSKNHPVYLFNYFHGVGIDTTVSADQVHGTQLSACNTYASSWQSGFTDGTGARARCGPRGAVSTGHATKQYVTHRDFPS